MPLLGIRGGITYNPCLALRQFSYARRDGTHDMLIQDIIFDYDNDLQGYHRRFVHAWGMVKKTDTKTMGHKNSIPWEPYLKWVQVCAQSLMMSYASILPITVESVVEGDEPCTILHPDMPTDFEELKRSWIQLKEEKDTFEAQSYASEKRVLELTKILHEERSINAYVNIKRKRPWEA